MALTTKVVGGTVPSVLSMYFVQFMSISYDSTVYFSMTGTAHPF